MQIFVKDLKGNTWTVEVEYDDPIAHIKDQLYYKIKIPPCEFNLTLRGFLLYDDRTLESYNIQKETTLYLDLRLRGD